MRYARLQIGHFALEPFRQLTGREGVVCIGRKSLEILSVLALARGTLVTKSELMQQVWRDVIVEENAIHVHVFALRKILSEDAGLLVTVHGLGYRLEIEPVEIREPATSPNPVSIAVLRFTNMTGNDQLDYLGEGLAEELTNTLSRTSDFIVSSRTSSFAYTDQNIDARTIGSELCVDTLLEGSVRVADDRMRVTAQLIDTENGFHLWSQNFDHSMSDMLTMQDDLASAIADGLTVHLNSSAPTLLRLN